jgi:hypothetical protein
LLKADLFLVRYDLFILRGYFRLEKIVYRALFAVVVYVVLMLEKIHIFFQGGKNW